MRYAPVSFPQNLIAVAPRRSMGLGELTGTTGGLLLLGLAAGQGYLLYKALNGPKGSWQWWTHAILGGAGIAMGAITAVGLMAIGGNNSGG